MKDFIRGFVAALLSFMLFYLILSIVRDEPEGRKAELAQKYLPSDIGEKSILWLEPNADGVLTLQWEKHAILGYGMAQVPVSKN